jgi:hypothetical protein
MAYLYCSCPRVSHTWSRMTLSLTFRFLDVN